MRKGRMNLLLICCKVFYLVNDTTNTSTPEESVAKDAAMKLISFVQEPTHP